MYPKEEIGKLKCDLKTNLQQWMESKIDALCADRPRLKSVSVYLKRGLNNWLDREDMRINKMVDNSMLFITDENGNIDVDVVMEDLIRMFREMDTRETMIGVFPVEYGKGEVRITIPHNPMLDLVFGDLGSVRITADDIMEIKGLFSQAV